LGEATLPSETPSSCRNNLIRLDPTG
jgi:hypothetical protein